jgi:hypothetical protein
VPGDQSLPSPFQTHNGQGPGRRAPVTAGAFRVSGTKLHTQTFTQGRGDSLQNSGLPVLTSGVRRDDMREILQPR